MEYRYSEFDDNLPIIPLSKLVDIGPGKLIIRGEANVGDQIRIIDDKMTMASIATVTEVKHKVNYLSLGEWRSITEVLAEQNDSTIVEAFRSSAERFKTVQEAEDYLKHGGYPCACSGCVVGCFVCSCRHSYWSAVAKVEGWTLEQTMEAAFTT